MEYSTGSPTWAGHYRRVRITYSLFILAWAEHSFLKLHAALISRTFDFLPVFQHIGAQQHYQNVIILANLHSTYLWTNKTIQCSSQPCQDVLSLVEIHAVRNQMFPTLHLLIRNTQTGNINVKIRWVLSWEFLSEKQVTLLHQNGQLSLYEPPCRHGRCCPKTQIKQNSSIAVTLVLTLFSTLRYWKIRKKAEP